jgi:hypothetical protein
MPDKSNSVIIFRGGNKELKMCVPVLQKYIRVCVCAGFFPRSQFLASFYRLAKCIEDDHDGYSLPAH